MNQEQFDALIKSLTIRNLLKSGQYDTLTDEQKAAYDTAAAAVIKNFRAKNPNGLVVKFAIDTIMPTNSGRTAIVCHNEAANPTGNTTFQYAPAMVANMARRAGVPSGEVMSILHATSLDDNFLELTFVASMKGEKFVNRSNGLEEVYKYTTIRTTGDKFELGSDARNKLWQFATSQLNQPSAPAVTRGNRAVHIEETEGVEAL